MSLVKPSPDSRNGRRLSWSGRGTRRLDSRGRGGWRRRVVKADSAALCCETPLRRCGGPAAVADGRGGAVRDGWLYLPSSDSGTGCRGLGRPPGADPTLAVQEGVGPRPTSLMVRDTPAVASPRGGGANGAFALPNLRSDTP